MIVRNSRAVMAGRQASSNDDVLEMYPTPPWGTRALCEIVLPVVGCRFDEVLEPCAGENHMAGPLREYFARVNAFDVKDYGVGNPVREFLTSSAPAPWVVTNPPFLPVLAFIEHALTVAEVGVAFFGQTRLIETIERYRFNSRLTAFCPFAERITLNKGVWKPRGSTATSYAWFVWTKRRRVPFTRTIIIPPGSKVRFSRSEDEVIYRCERES